MKNIIILSTAILFTLFSAEAQVTEQYTMWNKNHFLVNPAAAGNSDFFDIALGFRRQWAGVSDAPTTFYATGHTVLNQPKTAERSALRISNSTTSKTKPTLKHAIGFRATSVEAGAFGRKQGMLSYALHLPVTNEIYMSFGLSAGMTNIGFNAAKASVLSQGDRTYEAYASGANQNMFDMNTGIYVYSDKFYVGYSAGELLQNNLDLISTEVDLNDRSKLRVKHQVIAGYHFDLNNDYRLSPSILLKQSKGAPLSYDLNATITYKQGLYIGAAYRSEDAISALFGIHINHLLRVGYAYDYTLSEIKEASTGSHEIFIGISLF